MKVSKSVLYSKIELFQKALTFYQHQGLLIILTTLKTKTLGLKFKISRKRNIVKCFLFSNHLIVTTRNGNGKLNLFKVTF